MASSLGVVKVPVQRCLVHPLGRGFAKKLDAFSPDSGPLKDWVAKAREAAGDAVVKSQGVLLELDSLMAVFDRRFEEISGTLWLPVEDGTRAPKGFKGADLPSSEFVELKYPASRTIDQMLEDAYAQAVTYQEKSRKRDLGTLLRLWDRRGTTEKAGYVIQLQALPRA